MRGPVLPLLLLLVARAPVRAALVCPGDIGVSTPGNSCGAVVSYSTPSDPEAVGVSCSPESGSVFPAGQTHVMCAGVESTFPPTLVACEFLVTVSDHTLPTIVCPGDITDVTSPGTCGRVVDYQANASDNCPAVQVVQAAGLESGATFPVGTTNVALQAVDGQGNTAVCSAKITILDHEKPQLVCDDLVAVTPAAVRHPVTATDACGEPDVVYDPPAETALPVGTTLVTATATDPNGNVARCTFGITVQCDGAVTAAAVACRLTALVGTVTVSAPARGRDRLVRLLEQARAAVTTADERGSAGRARASRAAFRKALGHLRRFQRKLATRKLALPAETRTALVVASAPIVTDVVTLAGG